MDYEMISKTMITMHYILFAAVALGYDGVVAAPTGAAGSTAILPTVPLIPAQNITLTFPRDSSYHSRFAYERHLLTIVLAAIALLLVGRFSNVLPHGRRRGPASATTCTALTTYTLVDPMSSSFDVVFATMSPQEKERAAMVLRGMTILYHHQYQQAAKAASRERQLRRKLANLLVIERTGTRARSTAAQADADSEQRDYAAKAIAQSDAIQALILLIIHCRIQLVVEKAALSAQVQDATTVTSALQSKLRLTEAELEASRAENAYHRSLPVVTQHRAERLEVELEDTRHALDDAEERLAAAEKQLDDVEERMEELEEENARVCGEAVFSSTATPDVGDAKVAFPSVQIGGSTVPAVLFEVVQDLKTQLEDAKTSEQVLQNQVNQYHEALSLCRDVIEEYQREEKARKQSVQVFPIANHSLQVELEDAKDKLREMSIQLQELTESNAYLRSILSPLSNRADRAEEALEEARREIYAAEHRAVVSEGSLKLAERRIEDLEEENALLRGEDVCGSSESGATSDLGLVPTAAIKVRLDELEASNMQLREQLSMFQGALSLAEEVVRGKDEELKQLDTEYKRSGIELQEERRNIGYVVSKDLGEDIEYEVGLAEDRDADKIKNVLVISPSAEQSGRSDDEEWTDGGIIEIADVILDVPRAERILNVTSSFIDIDSPYAGAVAIGAKNTLPNDEAESALDSVLYINDSGKVGRDIWIQVARDEDLEQRTDGLGPNGSTTGWLDRSPFTSTENAPLLIEEEPDSAYDFGGRSFYRHQSDRRTKDFSQDRHEFSKEERGWEAADEAPEEEDGEDLLQELPPFDGDESTVSYAVPDVFTFSGPASARPPWTVEGTVHPVNPIAFTFRQGLDAAAWVPLPPPSLFEEAALMDVDLSEVFIARIQRSTCLREALELVLAHPDAVEELMEAVSGLGRDAGEVDDEAEASLTALAVNAHDDQCRLLDMIEPDVDVSFGGQSFVMLDEDTGRAGSLILDGSEKSIDWIQNETELSSLFDFSCISFRQLGTADRAPSDEDDQASSIGSEASEPLLQTPPADCTIDLPFIDCDEYPALFDEAFPADVDFSAMSSSLFSSSLKSLGGNGKGLWQEETEDVHHLVSDTIDFDVDDVMTSTPMAQVIIDESELSFMSLSHDDD